MHWEMLQKNNLDWLINWAVSFYKLYQTYIFEMKIISEKKINMLQSMVIEKFSKLLLLLCRYRSQVSGYAFKSVNFNLMGFADNIVYTSSFMKYWSPGMGNISCTENCLTMVNIINESTGMCPLITSTIILYLRWKVLMIKMIILLIWIVIKNWCKLLHLFMQVCILREWMYIWVRSLVSPWFCW